MNCKIIRRQMPPLYFKGRRKMNFMNPYLGIISKFNLLENWLLVQSIIYYYFDTNIVSDCMYDANAHQLVALIGQDKKAFAYSDFYYVFQDYDGSTGYDLVGKLKKEDYNKVYERASQAMAVYNKFKG